MDDNSARARVAGDEEILTPEALRFLEALHARFARGRDEILAGRRVRRERAAKTGRLDFLEETWEVREAAWTVAPAPADLIDRRTEITGPTDRKMTINALNSGARVWLADFEDANTPHWRNVVSGQVNLRDAIRRTIDFETPDGRRYALGAGPRATILARPRGWHLEERNLRFDGQPASGSLVDFGLYFFHNAAELLRRGSGPYFYLAKLEGHLEARLWNEVFVFAQEYVGLPLGTIRATILIETAPAAFEMDEILFELRDHASGLNAGRWDYLFSVIKYFGGWPEFVLPDRGRVGMTVPFMRAYSDLLVATCHRRNAHAMGGMAAFIPNRHDQALNERAFAAVRSDKEREATAGFDGSWVAHPDLVPLCDEVFGAAFGDAPNQKQVERGSGDISVDDLLDVASVPGAPTRDGLDQNIEVSIRYLAAWFGGLGAVAIDNLMEDAATVEISRSQIWQWIRHRVALDTGATVTCELVAEQIEAASSKVQAELSSAESIAMLHQATEVFRSVVFAEEFVDFLTLPAYELLYPMHPDQRS